MCIVHIASKKKPPDDIKRNELIFWWDKQDIASSEYSIPKWYEDNFLNLRNELTDFVYNISQLELQNKTLHQHFCVDDRLSMWWSSLIFEKHPMLTPQFYNILKLRAFECMLRTIAPHCTKIILHFNDKKLEHVLNQFCMHNQLDFHIQRQKSKLKLLKPKNFCHYVYKKLFPEIKTIIRFIHWLVTVRIHLPLSKTPRPRASCITMLSYYPHAEHNKHNTKKSQEFHSPYWGSLQDLLKKHKNINWLFMRINQPNQSLKQAKQSLNALNLDKSQGQSFHFVEEFLSLKDILQVIIRYFKLVCISRKLETQLPKHCFFANSTMSLWPYLKPYYKESFQGWICFERALQRKAILNFVTWAGPQDYTLYPMENCPWERALIEAIHYAKAGPIYGAQHSALRHTDLRYFDSANFYNKFQNLVADKILVNGDVAYKLLSQAHCPKNKLLRVEALRYEYLLQYTDKITNTTKLNNTQTKTLLVITSFFRQITKNQLKLLDSWLKHGNNARAWQIIIKAHPFCNIDEMLQKYLGNTSVKLSTKSITSLLQELQTQGGIVFAANDTSVIIEAMYAKIPLFIQGAKGFNLCPVQGIDALKYVYTYRDVHAALAKPQILKPESQFFILDSNLARWRDLLAL